MRVLAIWRLPENYINEYYTAAKYGKYIGCKLFFEIEVTMEVNTIIHMLIYGLSEDFSRENPELFDMTQKELYSVVHKNNGILVQTHPFRKGTTILDTNYLE